MNNKFTVTKRELITLLITCHNDYRRSEINAEIARIENEARDKMIVYRAETSTWKGNHIIAILLEKGEESWAKECMQEALIAMFGMHRSEVRLHNIRKSNKKLLVALMPMNGCETSISHAGPWAYISMEFEIGERKY